MMEPWLGRRIAVRSLANLSPHRRLLLRVVGRRHLPPWQAPPWRLEERRTKADLARALGWVPAGASDAHALQAFKGRRTDLVRAVPVTPWDRAGHVTVFVDFCCHHVYCPRTRGIRD